MTPTPYTSAPALMATDSLAQVLFGPSARIVAEGGSGEQAVAEVLTNAASLTDNLVVKLGLVILFVVYMLTTTVYWGQFGGMLKIILTNNIGIKVADELSYLFVKAMRTAAAMGILTWSLVAVGAVRFVGIDISALGVGAEWCVPVCIATIAGMLLFGWLLTRGVCWLIRRSDLGEGLEVLAEATMALAAVVATPLALLFVVAGGGAGPWLLGALSLIAAVGLFTYTIKSFIFFLEQKISFLLWLLYLCAAFLIPLGIIVSTVLHNNTP